MRTRTLLAGATIATALAYSGGAQATLIDLGGYTGPIQFKFQDYESFTSTTLAPGVQNFGVVKVTSIVNPTTGGNLWVQGQAGQFLAAVFNGITIASVTATSSGFVTTNSGGTFQLWLDSADFDPAQGTSGYTNAAGCAVGGLCYNGITNTGGTDLLNFDLVPGTTSDPTNTLNATVNSTTVPVAGVAEAYGDITGGADAAEFGRGGFTTALGTAADLHFRDNFCVPGTTGCAGPLSSNWENFSFDPVDAMAVTPPIPEPASLALLATALLGLGALGRRNRRRM